MLAIDQVRYQGEPVALVAADHPETARRRGGGDRGASTSPARGRDRPPPSPARISSRHQPVRRGDTFEADVVVTGEYEVGMQDQAFLGPESGLAVPAEDGGVDLYIATQWLHVDRDQIAPCLGLPPDKVRLTLAGRRRRVRRPGGPVDAGPRLHAGAAH